MLFRLVFFTGVRHECIDRQLVCELLLINLVTILLRLNLVVDALSRILELVNLSEEVRKRSVLHYHEVVFG